MSALIVVLMLALALPFAAIGTAAAFGDHPDSDAPRPDKLPEIKAKYEALQAGEHLTGVSAKIGAGLEITA